MGERSGAPRASALHQSSFRNLRLRFNYRSQMSQLTVTHPSPVLERSDYRGSHNVNRHHQRIRLRSMAQLSPTGFRAVEEIAQRTGFSRDAVTSMLLSLVAGGGGMAQFSHSEFGGSGQWMAGGSIMISDMFNNALKARVDALCIELSALISERTGLCRRRLVSIAKPRRAQKLAAWILKPPGH